jgi:hypothetical protein
MKEDVYDDVGDRGPACPCRDDSHEALLAAIAAGPSSAALVLSRSRRGRGRRSATGTRSDALLDLLTGRRSSPDVKAFGWSTNPYNQAARDVQPIPGNTQHVTVHDRLVALGADDRETRDAETLLARCVPLGRPVVLTDEVVAAARAGDAVLLAVLLAPEVPAEEDERAALRELADGPAADRERISLDVP